MVGDTVCEGVALRSQGVTDNKVLHAIEKTPREMFTPDLFKEGSGVVAEGRLDPNGLFVADNILAKHDERYMPPQMANEAIPR